MGEARALVAGRQEAHRWRDGGRRSGLADAQISATILRMAGKREILAQLSRDDLLGLVDAYGFEAPDRRVKTPLVER